MCRPTMLAMIVGVSSALSEDQVSEAAKQMSTLRVREEEQIQRRKKAEEDAARIQKARENCAKSGVL